MKVSKSLAILLTCHQELKILSLAMKIISSSITNLLAIEMIKNKSFQSLLEANQNNLLLTKSDSTTSSQLSLLLKNVNVYPLLHSILNQYKTSIENLDLSFLIKNMSMPNKPEYAIKWLYERQADKNLLETLNKVMSLDLNNELNIKLKTVLMLIAEQRIQDTNRYNDINWMFPLSEQNLNPVKISIKNKEKKKRKKSSWSITLNLTLAKNKQLTAMATLDNKELNLKFSTTSKDLAKLIDNTIPIFQQQLNKHHIVLSTCKVDIKENQDINNNQAGFNIIV